MCTYNTHRSAKIKAANEAANRALSCHPVNFRANMRGTNIFVRVVSLSEGVMISLSSVGGHTEKADFEYSGQADFEKCIRGLPATSQHQLCSVPCLRDCLVFLQRGRMWSQDVTVSNQKED